MPKINIRLKVTHNSLSGQIEGMIRALGSTGRRKIFVDAGRQFLKMTQSNFGTTGPYRGNKWKSYSKSYAKKVGSSVATLLRTGKLRDSIQMKNPRGNYVEVSTDNPYARAQLLGYPPRNLPSRIYFPMERLSSTYWRPVFATERQLVFTISKTLNILSGGAFSRINMGSVTRSTPTQGDPTKPITSSP